MGAVKDALAALPCVEKDSIQVDIKTKEARFNAKKDAKVDIEAVKKAIADAGNFSVTKVKGPPAK